VTEYYPLGSLFTIIAKARDGDHNVIRQLSWTRWARSPPAVRRPGSALRAPFPL
jgi:hypothetical protein